VGASGPKLGVEDLLADLEDIVKDAIVGGATADRYLGRLLEIVFASIADGRPLFNNPLDEPAFYRTFRRWVMEGLGEVAKLSQDQKTD
jgi:hypothetical protein